MSVGSACCGTDGQLSGYRVVRDILIILSTNLSHKNRKKYLNSFSFLLFISAVNSLTEHSYRYCRGNQFDRRDFSTALRAE